MANSRSPTESPTAEGAPAIDLCAERWRRIAVPTPNCVLLPAALTSGTAWFLQPMHNAIQVTSASLSQPHVSAISNGPILSVAALTMS